jgi:hypothetical protein
MVVETTNQLLDIQPYSGCAMMSQLHIVWLRLHVSREQCHTSTNRCVIGPFPAYDGSTMNQSSKLMGNRVPTLSMACLLSRHLPLRRPFRMAVLQQSPLNGDALTLGGSSCLAEKPIQIITLQHQLSPQVFGERPQFLKGCLMAEGAEKLNCSCTGPQS